MTLRYDWYLIDVFSGMMDEARCEIQARDVQFCCPQTWRRERLASGHYAPVPYQMLPGNYAFVRLSSDPDNGEHLKEQAAALKLLRGVREIYRSPGRERYSVVPKWEVQGLIDTDNAERKAAKSKRWEPKELHFKPGATVRILRHATAEGHKGEFLFTVRGMATLAMDNGIKLSVPDCDLVEVTGEAARAVA